MQSTIDELIARLTELKKECGGGSPVLIKLPGPDERRNRSTIKAVEPQKFITNEGDKIVVKADIVIFPHQ